MAEITLKDALLKEGTLIVAPEHAASKPSSLDAAVKAVLGNDAEKIKASIVPLVYTGHLRRGDLIVIAVETSPGSFTLKGPHNVSSTWNPLAKMKAGDIEPKTFFNALGQLAHPMILSRRTEADNGYFMLRTG